MFIANEAIFSVPFSLFQSCELSLSFGVIFHIKNVYCAREPGRVKAYRRIISKIVHRSESSLLFHVNGPKMHIVSRPLTELSELNLFNS
jgi:hypothetical protein